MDYRNIVALGFLVLAIGYTWKNMQTAHALQTGPTISMGSNPIDQAYKYCNGLSDAAILTNSSTQDFIVTDIVVTNGIADILIDGTPYMTVSGHIPLQTGLRVSSGSVVSCTDSGSYPKVTVTGYYTHTP